MSNKQNDIYHEQLKENLEETMDINTFMNEQVKAIIDTERKAYERGREVGRREAIEKVAAELGSILESIEENL